jgi:archaellum component FlaF (FlaF/FlaG flagellin family)
VIPGYANNVDVSGNYAYVAAGAAGLHVVNVSDPQAPVIVGALDTPGNANDVRVVGTLAYVADGGAGLQIIEVSSPSAPILRGTFDTPGDARDVRVISSRAYIADGEAGLRIVEVSNPAVPILLGTVDTPGIANGVDVSGTLAVVAEQRNDPILDGLVTIDVSVPATPQILARLQTSDAADVTLRGSLVYLAGGFIGPLQIVDIEVPTNPQLLAFLPILGNFEPADLDFFSRFVLAADSFNPSNRMTITDVFDPANPLFVAEITLDSVVPVGERYGGTGVALTPQYVYTTGVLGEGLQNGVTGTSRLFLGQYLKFPDDTAGVPPVVRIVTPSVGALVAEEGQLPIEVEATDDIGVAAVDILVNGQVVAPGTDVFSYPIPLGATSLTIEAHATDAGGNVGAAPEVVVTVVPDTAPPEVRITAPTAGSTVTEQATLPVTVFAADNVAVASVDLLVNGQVVQTLTSDPYEFTITVPTGVSSLTLSARAIDHKGQEATAPSVTLPVVQDTTAPAVTITSPITGDTVRGLTVVQMTVEASDNVGVTAVDFLVNGEVVGTATSAPYQFGVTIPNTATSARLGAQARDAGGNVGTATEVLLTVTQDQPPTVTLTAPSSGATVMAGSTVTLQADATDDDAGTVVHFLIDGQLVFVARRTPYQFHLRVPTDVSTLRLGVTAVDSGGQMTTGTEVLIPVSPDPKTTATGRVVDGSGVPLAGTRVTCLGMSGTAAADGSFSIPGVATARGAFACSASLTMLDNTLLGGTSAAVTPVGNGTTGLGDVMVRAGSRYPGLRVSVEQPRPINFGGFDSAVSPVGLVTGDLNGDGHSDLVTANRRVLNLSLLFGAGEGTFQPPQTLGLNDEAEALALADLNTDGRLDLIVAPAGTTRTQIGILLGNGNGTFQPQQRVTVGTSPSAVTTADVNGDGKLDVLVVNNGSDDISILLGTGTGTFQPQQRVAVADSPREIAVSELNGDGHLDLAIVHNLTGPPNQVSILLGTGTGTFQVQPVLAIDSDIRALALGDLNGDGAADLVVTETQSSPPALYGGVRILLGTGTGAFQAAALVLTNNYADRVVMADLTGDTHLDLVVTGGVDEGTVLVGNGNGSFATSLRFVVGRSPSAIAVTEVTGDGVMDVAVTNEDSNDVSVLVGRGDGTLDSGQSYATSGPSSVLEHADVNRDGIEDLPMVSGNDVAVLLGVGDGSFDAANEFLAERTPAALTVADVNGDGSEDLVVANGFSADEVEVFLGTRYGTFPTSGTRLAVGERPVAVEAGDVNRDGALDVVTLNRNSSDMSVLLGTGSGTFQAEQRFPIGMLFPTNMTLADLNGDGTLDVVTANGSEDFVSLLLGTGTGTFAAAQTLPVAPGDTLSAVAAADVNGDSHMDLLLVVTHQGSTDVVVWLGTGTGTFQPERRTPLGSTADAFTVTDIDGDGELDCVLTKTFGGRVTVALGTGDGMFGRLRSYGVGESGHAMTVADVNGDGQPDLLATGSLFFNQGRLLVLLHR